MICPAPPGSLHGNRRTAVRWARIIRGLGQRVRIAEQYDGSPCDVLIALHARRSAEAALCFREQWPAGPLIVALTGTDLYNDIHHDPRAREVIEAADRLVALQPLGLVELGPDLRRKAAVIYQSAEPTRNRPAPTRDSFEVCVAGHLREVKDPFRAALAARGLPPESRIRVLHAGGAREPEMADQAHAEAARNPRYRWLGELPRRRVRRLIARSRLMVLSSIMEGGANVISEAVVDKVPVLASRIPGSVGLLGEDYPGYFPARDTAALAGLLRRAEVDRAFYKDLKSRCARLAPLFRPARERAAWKALLQEIE